MKLNLERVRHNVAQATTEDLLDRATVYRADMEPEALEVIEEELLRRGVQAAKWAEHADRQRQAIVRGEDGPVRCCRCSRPAVRQGWTWYRFLGVLPLFRRQVGWCAEHKPKA